MRRSGSSRSRWPRGCTPAPVTASPPAASSSPPGALQPPPQLMRPSPGPATGGTRPRVSDARQPRPWLLDSRGACRQLDAAARHPLLSVRGHDRRGVCPCGAASDQLRVCGHSADADGGHATRGRQPAHVRAWRRRRVVRRTGRLGSSRASTSVRDRRLAPVHLSSRSIRSNLSARVDGADIVLSRRRTRLRYGGSPRATPRDVRCGRGSRCTTVRSRSPSPTAALLSGAHRSVRAAGRADGQRWCGGRCPRCGAGHGRGHDRRCSTKQDGRHEPWAGRPLCLRQTIVWVGGHAPDGQAHLVRRDGAWRSGGQWRHDRGRRARQAARRQPGSGRRLRVRQASRRLARWDADGRPDRR